MEMEIKNEFWFLEDNKNTKKWLFDNEKDAIEKLTELINNGIEPEKTNLQIMEVEEEELKLKPVLWQKVAVSLIKSNKKRSIKNE